MARNWWGRTTGRPTAMAVPQAAEDKTSKRGEYTLKGKLWTHWRVGEVHPVVA